ncbi:RdgB/HAM1 family non-canonical purine NTP pyrophosphatase [Spiroplasma cantharicola]|uniref:dITP/XTP pyrophosphatase n=1 Tax=Spiroplasma cantharicola TaxID=362837 RepID=A0A0M3SJ81_9MOLU|nr:RdgB/HAM1 family non-canonical purine NTP pyrophosphatase [Spiroplasma cantharicola]ALD66274.1 dITP/XTP pyrophosphatase [Spiroplasma cantharicola]
MSVLWFASQNLNKIKEMKEMIPEMEIKSLNDLKEVIDIPENEPTFEENALFKARTLANLIEGIVVADDSGLSIKNLDNFPGIYSARWAKPEKDWVKINELLLEKLRREKLIEGEERKAFFTSAIALIDKDKGIEEVFTGIVNGVIVDAQIGENGFAYDRIFKPNNFNKTFAQMTKEEKNAISHRKLSISKLREYLQKNNYF